MLLHSVLLGILSNQSVAFILTSPIMISNDQQPSLLDATQDGGGTHDDEFTQLEHVNWQRGVDAYTEGFGPLTAQAVPRLLRAAVFPSPIITSDCVSDKNGNANMTSETHLLDVACGPGQVLDAAISMAKDHLQSTKESTHPYRYTALDFSSNFLSLAKHNLAASHPDISSLGAITYVEGDAQNLPFPDHSYHSITCNFGILHLSMPKLFLQESFRVLKPGGRLSFSCWAVPPKTEGFELILGAVRAAGNMKVPLPDGPDFFQFAKEENVIQSLSQVGFEDIQYEIAEEMVWHNVESAGQMYRIFLEGTARTRELLKGQTDEETKAIMIELEKRWEVATDGGRRKLKMPAVVASGRKPH